jgi:6-phosphogluconate dehydrogenase
MEKSDIALAGLTGAGRILALNLARHKYRVAVYDRAPAILDSFIQGSAKGMEVIAAKSMSELAGELKSPRRVLLALDAGSGVDAAIDALIPLLEAGDIILDCGNSFFVDTERREKALANKGIRFMGVGVAFGEDSAQNGFCVMPGGSKETLLAAGRALMDIAARVDGAPCCAWIGPGGSGHFAKAVHDGIECAVLQLIGESYALMRELLSMTAEETQAIFRLWNSRELNSHLVEITCDILGNADALTEKTLVDLILDETQYESSVGWAGMQALLAGSPAPSLAEAAFARAVSSRKNERMVASRLIEQAAEKPTLDKYAFIDDIGPALYAATICVWAQGFALLHAGSTENGWNLKLGEIAMIWGGGVLRSSILRLVKEAFGENPLLPNLMLAPAFRPALEDAQFSWRRVVSISALAGVPTPCLGSALSYFDGCRAAHLPANLMQAQLDYMGKQPYRRVDRPGEFHTEWKKDK